MTRSWLVLTIGIFCFILLLGVGCGQNSSPSSSPSLSINYHLSGQVTGVTVLSASGVKSLASLPVTHIVAIGADNNKYLADYDAATGTFSVGIVKGMPYALGFYNQSSGKITLLGYLKQNDVNWHSLPLMSVTGEATDLGTIEVNTTSAEAVPSIALNDLLAQTDMDQATANLYGQVDELMTMFTNVDVDGNGVFDFNENKAYMLQIVIGTNLSSLEVLASGEVGKMLNQYDESYYPVPNVYQIIFHAKDAPNPADRTAGNTDYPTTIRSNDGQMRTSCTGETWGSSSYGWNYMTDVPVMSELLSPAIVPSGSYTFEVTGKGRYTFNNVVGVPVAAIGVTDGLIFPVFKMETDGAGYLARIDYKWLIRDGTGLTREATPAEVKAVIVNTDQNSNNLIEASPSIGVYLGNYDPVVPPTSYRPPLKLDRDAGTIDVHDWGGAGAVKFSDIGMFSCNYKINSNVSLQFMFMR